MLYKVWSEHNVVIVLRFFFSRRIHNSLGIIANQILRLIRSAVTAILATAYFYGEPCVLRASHSTIVCLMVLSDYNYCLCRRTNGRFLILMLLSILFQSIVLVSLNWFCLSLTFRLSSNIYCFPNRYFFQSNISVLVLRRFYLKNEQKD